MQLKAEDGDFVVLLFNKKRWRASQAQSDAGADPAGAAVAAAAAAAAPAGAPFDLLNGGSGMGFGDRLPGTRPARAAATAAAEAWPLRVACAVKAARKAVPNGGGIGGAVRVPVPGMVGGTYC